MNKRITAIDITRGFCILYVVFYHLMYDLVNYFNVNINYQTFDIFNIIRDGFVITLVIISGISCNFSRNNIKRGIYCVTIAYVLTFITYLADSQFFIVFGILHMFGFSMLIYGVFKKYFIKVKPIVGIIIFSILFIITFNLNQNIIGIKDLLYIKINPSTSYLFPLGIKSNAFTSSDYYALIPWFFAFLCGTYIGKILKTKQLKDFMYTNKLKTISFIGSHTMIIYLVHQPILIGVLWLIFKII